MDPWLFSQQTAGASLLHEITIRLDPDNDLNAASESISEASSHNTSTPEAYVTHLFPTERPNILACMKALILGFVDRSPDGLVGACPSPTMLHLLSPPSFSLVSSVSFSLCDLCTQIYALESQKLDQPKRKPSMSLAPYDIELLEAWFEVVRKAHGMSFTSHIASVFLHVQLPKIFRTSSAPTTRGSLARI